MEHHLLVEELREIENMTLVERIELAKKRRTDQVDNYYKWSRDDSGPASEDGKADSNPNHEGSNPNHEGNQSKRIRFTADTELTQAVSEGNLKDLKALLDQGINPNCTTYEGLTPLHHSCIEGNLEIVNLLLLKGADVNARDSDGWTPLHAAATCGHKEIVELLVRTGANLLALNEDGDMAFQITDDEDTLYFLEKEMLQQGITEKMTEEMKQEKYLQLKKDIQRVIREDGDINAPVTINNGSFLHVTISHFYNDLVKLLLNNNASDTTADIDGWRPIHVAAYWENMAAVELLVKTRNTDLNAMTYNGERPYDICEDSSCRIYILRILNNHTINSKPFINEALENNFTSESNIGLGIIKENPIYQNEINNAENIISTDLSSIESNDSESDFESDFSTDKHEGIVPTLYKPVASEITSERKSSAVRDAKKHAPLIRALSFERSISLGSKTFQEDLLASVEINQELQNDQNPQKEIIMNSLHKTNENLKAEPLEHSPSFTFDPHLIPMEMIEKLRKPKSDKIVNSSELTLAEGKQKLFDISSEDLLATMLQLPTNTNLPNSTNEFKMKSTTRPKSMNSNSKLTEEKGADININGLENNSTNIGTNNSDRHGVTFSDSSIKYNPNNKHKVLTRLNGTKPMQDHYLSQDCLFILKQQRIEKRNKQNQNSIQDKTINTEVYSKLSTGTVSGTLNNQYDFKQLDNETKLDPSIFKKSHKCNVM